MASAGNPGKVIIFSSVHIRDALKYLAGDHIRSLVEII
jgi:hypothetical protein